MKGNDGKDRERKIWTVEKEELIVGGRKRDKNRMVGVSVKGKHGGEDETSV